MDVRDVALARRLVSEYKRYKGIEVAIGNTDDWVLLDTKIVQFLSNNSTVQNAGANYVSNRLGDIESELTALDIDISNIGQL
jgi:hypothetical protein